MINLDEVRVAIVKGSVERIPNVDDSDYFGELYEEYISNSSLRYINPDEDGSAHSYRNRITQQSAALELGSAVHKMVLEGDNYFLSEVEKPRDKLAELVELAYVFSKENENTYSEHMKDAMSELKYYNNALSENRIQSAIEEGKAYFDFLVSKDNNPGAIVLNSYLKGRLEKAVASIKANRAIYDLLTPSNDIFDVRYFAEDVITASVYVTVPTELLEDRVELKVKCKIDSWSIDLDNKIITLNDLKTTSASIQGFMGKHSKKLVPSLDFSDVEELTDFSEGSFQKWHYYRQMGMYAWMLINHCMQEYNITATQIYTEWTVNVNMIVAETIAPFNAYSFNVNENWRAMGIKELNRLLGRIAWHTKYGWDKIIELHDN